MKEFTIPVSTRYITGYAAATLAPINIPDVHDIPRDCFSVLGNSLRLAGRMNENPIGADLPAAETAGVEP